jgi:tryptophanyl-tRNA synthetase
MRTLRGGEIIRGSELILSGLGRREVLQRLDAESIRGSEPVLGDVFPEPQPLLTPAAKLPGTDGRKMSKSYGNSILLSEPEPEVRKKLKTMVTDPARVRRTDRGNPDVCPVGDLHKIFSSADTIAKVREGCTTAAIGCIECKGWVADNIVSILTPIQERRRQYEDNPKLAWDILEAGSAKARAAADLTLGEVRESMRMSLSYEPPEKCAE